MIKRPLRIVCVLSILCVCHAFAADPPAASRQVRTVNGVVEGGAGADGSVRFFGGIPYAAPPVGELRWKAPQPAADWAGVRKATAFGPHCLQAHPSFGLVFVDRGENEDCLFVNVWTPAKSATQKLPVLVWIHGGAFTDGASSKARYDGEHLAKKGIVVVSLNYRLGVFGLFAHPELTKESDAHASGNQGLLDQVAALRWVAANIAAFGGDPGNVTIAGESAGSQSVSALMVAPIAQPYFQKAIGESGALFHTIDNEYVPHPLADAEAAGAKFAKSIDAPSLAALRAMPADALSQAAANSSSFKPAVDIDGDLVKASVVKVFADGAQAHVPLLAGWNADEGTLLTLPAKGKLTLAGYKVLTTVRFGFDVGTFLKLYPADNDAQAYAAASQLAGDDFVAYATWKWLNVQGQSGQPVYRYYFEQVPANKPGAMLGNLRVADMGSYHSAELEYVFQTVQREGVPVTPGDVRLAELMSSYWANFAKTGNPNAPGLPDWPAYGANAGWPVMHLRGDASRASPEDDRARYQFIDAHAVRPK